MNLSRLMVLGLLASHGPRHGHQIRRDAELTNVGNWGGVNVGALYRELHRMEEEGLVEPLKTEQIGNRPARTVYRITGEGHRELKVLRERAILELSPGPDTLAVALLFGRVGDREELAGQLRARRESLAAVLTYVAAERVRGQARGHFGPLEASMFRRKEIAIEAELRWHDEFDLVLADLADPLDAPPDPMPTAPE
jgi:DNA-binding PadR family transcriptional regulator